MLRKIMNVVRDSWLMVGIALVMFLLLEGAYRLQSAIRGKAGPETPIDSTRHPYAGQGWFHQLSDGPAGVNAMDYRLDSYRGHWPAPVRSAWLNVDSAGRRLTVNRTTDPATATRIFMLGGSSMWGFTSRDSFTIPSLLGARLAERGFANVEVVNLSQAGFNATQEATSLLVELAKGNIPHIAVFLDGYNDVASGIHQGRPGQAFSLDVAQRRVDLGKRGFWGELVGLGRHSRLIQRLAPARSSRPAREDRNASQLCAAIAGYYRRVHLSIDGMAAAYGVRTVTLLQPHHGMTRKPLTPWEQSLGKATLIGQCMGAIDSTMSDRLGAGYYRAYPLFDSDTQTVFVDRDSHVTEAANQKIADYIAEILVPIMDSTAKR